MFNRPFCWRHFLAINSHLEAWSFDHDYNHSRLINELIIDSYWCPEIDQTQKSCKGNSWSPTEISDWSQQKPLAVHIYRSYNASCLNRFAWIIMIHGRSTTTGSALHSVPQCAMQSSNISSRIEARTQTVRIRIVLIRFGLIKGRR